MNIWQRAFDELKCNHSLVLMKVVWHHGSSPGRQGFEMLVMQNGELEGSIGGGRTEFRLVEHARLMLKNKNPKIEFKKEVHRSDDPDTSGMICSGEQWVALIPLYINDLTLVEKIKNSQDGSIILTSNGLTLNETLFLKENTFQFQTLSEWEYCEKIHKKSLLYVIGGGHVGLATVRIFRELDFEVHWFDNRESLNTFQTLEGVFEQKVIDYTRIIENIQDGWDTYVLILTHNFESDADVLRLLEPLTLRYIGVLGSKSKVKQMLNGLLAKGVSKEFIQSVDAPIGLPIQSETPAEIGISIAAKLISLRNKK